MSETTWTEGDASSSETLTDDDHLYPSHVNELRTALNALEAILDPDTSVLTSPVITSMQINDTSADHQYVFAVNELTADRTVTLPLLTGDDEFVFKDHTQTLTNKTLTSATLTSPTLNTSVAGTAVLDEDDMASDSATKVATQQSIKAYIDSGTVTMTNKTLTSAVLTTPQINDTSSDHQYVFAVSELTADRTVTLPLLTGNDEFVFKAHTQTLTNKTLTSPSMTTPSVTSGDVNLADGLNIQEGSTDPWKTIDLAPGFLKPTTTSGCADSATEELATNDIDYDYLAFDKDTDERAFCNFAMPGNWDGGAIQFRFYWTTDTGGGAAETVVMELSGRSYADGDAGDQAVGTAVEVSDTWEADKDFMTSSWSSDITLAGTPAAGEFVHLELMRDVSEDDLAEDARIKMVQIRYKESQYNHY